MEICKINGYLFILKKRVDNKLKIIQEYVIILEFQSPGIP